MNCMMHKGFQSRWTAAVLCLALIFGIGGTGTAAASQKKTDYFAGLKQRLIRDGFSAEGVSALYAKPSVAFDFRGVSLYFVHQESKLNYDQFLEPGPINKARAYMANHQAALIKAEQGFGVSRHVITAILLVETRLGDYIGNRYVLNTLSTMAALEDAHPRNALWAKVSSTTHLSKSEFKEKARRKSGWAYQELKAFLKYTAKEQLNPATIVGSYAGAMGYCQFMPSNILILAKDGDGDGKINLFSHADAIMSIARYLNHYGWRSGISGQNAFNVVYKYNHSKYYVNTVLKIMKLLRS